jgi:hypothetical protein
MLPALYLLMLPYFILSSLSSACRHRQGHAVCSEGVDRTWQRHTAPWSQCPHRPPATVSQRRGANRRRGVPADADRIADRKSHQGLHPVPVERLLAPSTDDLQRGHDRIPAPLYGLRRSPLLAYQGFSFHTAMGISQLIRASLCVTVA